MFYVYILKNPLKNNKPFYVGKGKGDRAYRHFKAIDWKESASNPHKQRTMQMIKNAGFQPQIEIIPCQSEQHAFEIEIQTIKQWGRSADGGCLTNLCKGGQGNTSGEIPVKQYTVYREFVAEYSSVLKAAESLGIKHSSLIVSACKKSITSGNGVRTPYGFVWCYSCDDPDWSWAFNKKRPVYVYDVNLQLIYRAESLAKLHKISKLDPGGVSKAIKTGSKYKGFTVTFDPLH